MGEDEKSKEGESEEGSEDLKSDQILESSTEKADEEKSVEEKKKDEKVDVESLRKVIKVDQKENAEKADEESEEKPAEPKKKEEEKTESKSKDAKEENAGGDQEDGDVSRESLEQKRAILQNIKDFDFQIKKNQEDVGAINQKMESLSKDLDDLVSLYEIVSEQMNPFVGISNVTKKRLDALENFTKEIDVIKERTAELESFAERSGAKLKGLDEEKLHAKTIDTDALLGQEGEEKSEESAEPDGSEKLKDKNEDPVLETEGNQETKEEDVPKETPESEVQQPSVDNETNEPSVSEENLEEPIQVEKSNVSPIEFNQEIKDVENNEDIIYQNAEPVTYTTEDLSDFDFDEIIEKAFLSVDDQIDRMVNEFIESLKG